MQQVMSTGRIEGQALVDFQWSSLYYNELKRFAYIS